jgi:hypothetical protein
MRRSKKRGKKTTGGAGGQLPAVMASSVPPAGGKGQGLVVAGRGELAGGDRRALTALEFQGLAAVARVRGLESLRHRRTDLEE